MSTLPIVAVGRVQVSRLPAIAKLQPGGGRRPPDGRGGNRRALRGANLRRRHASRPARGVLSGVIASPDNHLTHAR